ncbi:MAG: beta-ketoacyl synthase N-terminal-like domain-containing protein, partial [Phycisphaerae bacterium]
MSLKLSIIALTPPGFAGAWSARAIGRSHPGLVGGASLEYSDAAQVRQAIGQLSEQTDAFTVAVGRVDDELLAVVKSAIGGGLVRVILCDADASRLSGDIQSLREGGVEAFVEATCLKEAQLAEQCRADGVVVKGNEAGGRVGQETTFILLQQVVGQVDLPVYARGGVGLFTSAACQAAGAAGVVLDWQLALCAESEVPEAVKTRIGRMDGSETAILGQDCPVRFRAYARPGETAFTALQALEASEELVSPCPDGVLGSWRAEVHRRAMVEALDERLLLIGQDAAFAGLLAEGTRGLVGICRAIQKEAGRLCRVAAHQKALAPHGPLAEAQGTRYPIVQGPMTRVSDTAEFAGAVARGGGLPFLALALLRGPDVAKLLVETKDNVGDQPWGIGILGFVPKELREEQLAEVSKCPPPFAIIAGGRPDQALALEQKGIKTYLHVPSPGLLGMFLSSGARRVIFEGRECGGHVGPRTSFALWESMIHVILQHLADTGRPGEDYHVLFAGGIHDAVSAAMVAALAAPLSERGVRIGALMGTAYLFTHEAVASGAIVPGFQQQAIACRETVLLETGVGHATRCANTSFGEQFLAEKRRLRAAGASKDDIRHKLEMLNLGRLRVASKAITRSTAETNPATDSKFAPVDEEGQLRDGMYMIGQVAALRDATCTIEQLHQEVSRDGIKHLEALDVSGRAAQKLEPCDVAIIGMSCVLPKAPDVRRFWSNIVGGVNAITEVPADLWDAELYFDGDRRARDKVYSKWGGFIEAIDFDPMHYGMPPNSLPSVEPLQLLTLELVRRALRDAGCEDRPFDREHTCVVVGAGGGVGNVGLGYGFRSMLPHYLDRANRPDLDAEELIQRLGDELPEWTEDSFAGLLLNVAAGRVANRFDLGGANYVVDAACASSLAAVRLATNELRSGAANLAIVGGVDTMQSPFAYLCFSKTQALSPRGQSCPFDESGDGIVISEGLAMVVLKRLEDAERDGDRIYAVIKGVGSSSDGKDKGLTAPRPAGQVRALERAYEQAGVSPRTVGLIEAHGTGTVVGDKTEVESLQSMFEAAGADRQSCAIGSVKSMIGHTKCTAGVAGLIKAALALHHKVLPPTHGVTTPNPKANFSESPFYVNTEARPWVHPEAETPRRAGVSAFGFGGTNFHAVLEEHGTDDELMEPVPGRSDWPGELFVWHRPNQKKLTEAIDSIVVALDEGAAPELPELAEAIGRANAGQQGMCRLAIVADSLDDLAAKLKSAASSIKSGKDDIRDPRGIYYGARVEPADGKVAAVFAGQGSQSVNMMRDLALTFPCVRRVFERADRALGDTLGKFVFVRPTFSDQERAEAQQALTQTRVAQPAIGAADLAAFELLRSLGVRPSFACGHSYGEYAALSAAGVLSFDELIRVSEARGRTIAAAAEDTPGTMAAVRADARKVTQAIEGIDGVWVANFNSPTQTVITGTEQGVTDALERLTAQGVAGRRIQVSCAFHSPLVAAARETFGRCLDDIALGPMRFEVYSNTTAQPHACDPAAVKAQLVEHLAKPVRFDEQIKAMHDAGARVFVEVGPGRTLTALVEQILEGRDFVAVAMDQAGRDGLVSLLHALARMTCAGINLDPGVLFEGRATRGLDVDRLVEQTKPAPPSPTTWSVSGSKAVPRNGGTRPTQAVPSGNGRPAASSNERQPATHARESARSRDRAGAVKEAAPVSRPPAPAGPTETNGGRDSVLGAHHQLMARFLETHKTVMLGYLQGASNGDGSHEAAARSSQSIQAGDATEVDPSHAATGPALPTARASAPETMDAAPPVVSEPGTDEPVTSPALAVGESAAFSREALIDRMLAVVSERTGYPADMLDLDQDLEADLGIDSIKRIEILGGLQNDGILGVEREADDADMEALAKLSTL